MALFSYGFLRNAVMASFLMAIIAPLLGVFLVIRRQSLLADTLSHVSLAGVAFGLFFQIDPTFSTLLIVVAASFLLLIVVAASFLLEYLRRMYTSYSEISIAMLMSGGLALALVLMRFSKNESGINIQNYLFGSIISITKQEVIILGVLTLLLVSLFFLFKRPLYVMTFDEDIANVDGLPVSLMSLLFNVLTGVAIAVMIPIAGALLISAIMVLPAAIAMKIGRSFNQVLAVSVVVGLLGMLGGLGLSFGSECGGGIIRNARRSWTFFCRGYATRGNDYLIIYCNVYLSTRIQTFLFNNETKKGLEEIFF